MPWIQRRSIFFHQLFKSRCVDEWSRYKTSKVCLMSLYKKCCATKKSSDWSCLNWTLCVWNQNNTELWFKTILVEIFKEKIELFIEEVPQNSYLNYSCSTGILFYCVCVSHYRYFLVDLEAPPSIVSTMMDHLGRDIDVIRRAFIKHPVSKTEECSGIIPVSFEDKLTAKKKWIF